MRARSSPSEMDAAARAALREALATIGVEVTPAEAVASGDDIVVRTPDGAPLPLDVRTAAVPSRDWLATLRPDRDTRIVVVADRIPASVRQDLDEREVAWLDRRGHLRLVGDGFFIDTDVHPTERAGRSPATRTPISGRSGLAAAAALLLRPEGPMGISEVARSSGLNASSISRATAALAEAQLAEQTGRGRYRPLVPELFWALADVWPRDRTALPLDADALADPRLAAHLTDPDHRGWAAGGERGAVAWGAPLVITGDYPSLLYVPDEESIRVARAIHGTAVPPNPSDAGGRPAIEVAVDPIGLVTRPRYASAPDVAPLAHPLFCALDLAATSRGREALDQWDPPEGFSRVW